MVVVGEEERRSASGEKDEIVVGTGGIQGSNGKVFGFEKGE